MSSSRRVFTSSALAIAIAGTLLLSMSGTWAHRESTPPYPTRAVTVVVPFPAGSGPDIVARVIGKKLEARLQQPFGIENRPGAGGNIGAAGVARSAPDGYTLLFASLSLTVFNPIIYKAMPHRPDDLRFVSISYESPIVIGVSGQSQAKSLKQLLEMLRSNPTAYSYGSAGPGTVSHVASEMLKQTVRQRLRETWARAKASFLESVKRQLFLVREAGEKRDPSRLTDAVRRDPRPFVLLAIILAVTLLMARRMTSNRGDRD